MIRGLLRLVVLVVVLGVIGAFFLGYRMSDRGVVTGPDERPVATTGKLPDVDTTRAREAGATIGEKVATGANQAQRALAEGALTAKIKSKMTLDDTIKAADINVDTVGTTVTLTGRVRTEAERTRALQLARETEGVTSVVDRIVVR
jgi:hypothetical protein